MPLFKKTEIMKKHLIVINGVVITDESFDMTSYDRD